MNQLSYQVKSPLSLELKTEDFAFTGTQEKQNQILRPSISYWQDAWRRLKKNKSAILSIIILIVIVIMCIIGPSFTSYGHEDVVMSDKNSPPSAAH